MIKLILNQLRILTELEIAEKFLKHLQIHNVTDELVIHIWVPRPGRIQRSAWIYHHFHNDANEKLQFFRCNALPFGEFKP